MSSTESTQVLIIGAGVAGLCASLFLADHGITSVVIERHSGTSIHPRARSVNARTMEFFRRIGIANRVREAGASIASSGGILQSNTLRDAVEARKRKTTQGPPPLSGFLGSTSPENGTFVTQDMLEPVLVEEARRRGIDIRFYTECSRVEQDAGGVTAVVERREDGRKRNIRAAYLIAADGAKSPIRSQLQIPSTGRGSMGHLLNILFEADLKELVHGREFSLLLVDRPEVTGLFTSIDNDKRWVFHLHFDPAKGQTPNDFPPAKCKDLLKIAIGIRDLDIEVKTILPWEPAVMVAEKMQQGRIFLAGDAAHQMPPYAGQGANSGIADAHNLSWKIAAVLQGQAGADLLTTYETERWPVGKAAAEISAIGCDDRGLLPVTKNLTFFQSVWQKLFIVAGYGYGYASDAIVAEPTGPLNGWTWRPWTISSLLFSIDGRPGRRVPHVWVEKAGEKQSTLDICGNRFVILAGADGDDWVRAAKAVSESTDMPIESYTVGPHGDLYSESGVFEAAAGLTSRGALLVRPDQFVAWRSRRQSSNPHVQIVDVVRQVMAISGD